MDKEAQRRKQLKAQKQKRKKQSAVKKRAQTRLRTLGEREMTAALERMMPAWARGPFTEITEEEGAALFDSSQVLDDCQTMGGTIDTYHYARTEKGLFRWRVTDDGVDAEDDEDEDWIDEMGPLG